MRFGVNSMRSQVLYRAAQKTNWCLTSQHLIYIILEFLDSILGEIKLAFLVTYLAASHLHHS